MRYLKFRWDERRGDAHDDWGGSWWYFEIGPDGYPTRQIEAYDSGVRLRYGPGHDRDAFGGLSYGHVDDMDAPKEELTAAEFEELWAAGPWHD